ncbi:MAG: FAD-dependent oxidoreductase [Acidimicrobiales bacterium]
MIPGTDVLVIGAGVIGSSVALELARSGRKVVVVDKGPAAGAGSTSSSSSIIRFSYSTLDAVLTAWEAAPAWEHWDEHLGVVDPDGMCRFLRTGMVLFDTPDFSFGRITDLWDDVGIPYELFDTDTLAARFPAFDLGKFYPPKRIDDPAFGDDAWGSLTALYEGASGFVDDPMLAARNLAYAAKHHGAEFRFHTEVVGVEIEHGRVAGVRISGGEVLRAPVVVNVGGPHSTRLNDMAGVTDEMRIRVRPLRQEVFAATAPAGLGLDDGGPLVSDLDLGQYFRPQIGGTLLVGGTEPECDELEWIDDPDRYDEHTTVEKFETTMYRLARRVPEFGIPIRPVGLAALYDVAEDWVPIYDRSALPGWYLACGTSGNQFKNAPIAGHFLRTIIDAVESGHDHDAEPVRYVGPRTGRAIDLGAFSRRRDPANTSGTVMG